MPIQCCFDVEPVSKSQFYEIDHLVMHHAFEIQNELGRFYNECVYHAELVRRCLASGLSVVSEGEIIVCCESFRKSYFLDALINSGSVCELKAGESLTGQHESQLLNYLFLANLHYGKLINFSSSSVQYRFVTTRLGCEKRMAYEIDDHFFRMDVSSSHPVRDIVHNLLTDWGAFLDVNLYREAIHHFLGGDNVLMRPVEIILGEDVVGSQKLCLLDNETSLHVSSVIHHVESYKRHLLKMLRNTNLAQMQWVSFNHENIQLVTLKK